LSKYKKVTLSVSTAFKVHYNKKLGGRIRPSWGERTMASGGIDAPAPVQGWKSREWKSQHQSAGGGNRGSGNRGTIMQGVEKALETSMEGQYSSYLTLLQVGYNSQ